LPDRVADSILLAAAGYSVGLPAGAEIGWIAAIAAMLTSYVRVLGRSLGAGTYIIGPMAKQHRMALLTGACLLAGCLAWVNLPLRRYTMLAALLLIIAGCAFTISRRLKLMFRDLGSLKKSQT
jgi:phosphatidylglycerophosphate synthase